MAPVGDAEQFVEKEFVVESSYAGWRLDRYLCHKIPRLSRTRVQQIISRDMISDRRLKPSTLVFPGLAFRLRKKVLEEPETPTNIREVYRDDSLLVVDKPAGLPIHPTARYHSGTLVALLGARYGEDSFSPVHRLDRETSGLVLCGRGSQATRHLMRAFANSEVEKEYLAICEGTPASDGFTVDAPIAEGGAVVRIAVRIDACKGKAARTRFAVLRRFSRDGSPFALLRANPETGRQHQIRVHLHHVGLPLVGDKMYGPDESYFDRFSRRQLEPEAWQRLRLPRHALHAALIRLVHPRTGEQLSFESPLPADLKAFLDG